MFHEEPHHQANRMPATGNDPTKWAALCGVPIQVDWLRIKLGGKFDDFVFVNLHSAKLETTSGDVVLKITRIPGDIEGHLNWGVLAHVSHLHPLRKRGTAFTAAPLSSCELSSIEGNISRVSSPRE